MLSMVVSRNSLAAEPLEQAITSQGKPCIYQHELFLTRIKGEHVNLE